MEIDSVEQTLRLTGMVDEDHYTTLAGFLLLTVWKAPPWIVVVCLGAAGTLLRLAPWP